MRRAERRSCTRLLFTIAMLQTCLAAAALSLPGAEESAQSSPSLAEEAKKLGLELVPVKVHARLRNASAAAESHARGGGGASNEYFCGARVRVSALGAGRKKEIQEVTSDAEGWLDVDLGERYRGTEVDLYIILPDRFFRSVPIQAGEQPDEVPFYSIANAPGFLVQQLFRVVTLQHETADAASPAGSPVSAKAIHVRQILRVANQSFHVYQDLPDGGCFFPLPKGAEILTLRVNKVDWLDRKSEDDPAWGHGIPIRLPLFPFKGAENEVLDVMGTFSVPMADGETVDLGLSSPVGTTHFMLGVEQGELHYLPPGDAAGGVTLVDSGSPEGLGVTQAMRTYQASEVPANTRISGLVLRGRPPVEAVTIIVTLLIVGGALFSILLGVALARRRRRESARASGAEIAGAAEESAAAGARGGAAEKMLLDRRLAQGEISVAEYKSGRAAPAGASRNSSAETVRAMRALAAARANSEDDDTAREMRDLIRLLDLHFREKP